MKKIFLLFMILGLSLMSFIDTQASTHDTIDGITLTTILQDLGNNNLVDVFENTNNYSDNNTYTSSSYGFVGYNYDYVLNNEYFIYYEQKCTSANFQGSFGVNRIFWSTGTVLYSVKDSDELQNEKFNPQYLSLVAPTTQNRSFYFYCSSSAGSTISIKNFLIVDLTYFGISQDYYKIHYYYRVYKQLKAQITSYDNGYDDGNLDGYATGFTDGTTYGRNEYHTGNYGTLDETQGIPYADGYNAGVTEELDTNYLLSFVQGSLAVLGAPILPNITLGVFVFIPLFFGFIAFLFRLGGKRG